MQTLFIYTLLLVATILLVSRRPRLALIPVLATFITLEHYFRYEAPYAYHQNPNSSADISASAQY